MVYPCFYFSGTISVVIIPVSDLLSLLKHASLNLLRSLWLICLLGALYRCEAQAPEKTLLIGYVISDANADIIQLASISTKSGQKVVSNRQGLFRLNVFPTDTIYFSAIGFESLTVIAGTIFPANKGDTIKLMMHSTSYRLEDVTFVYGNKRRDSIARAAAEFLKTDPLMNNNDRILKRPRGSGLSGPITEMYYQFSKAGKDMVKFEEFVRYYEAQKEVDKKYNKQVIKRATGLDDFYLDDFIQYCKMPRDFILQSNDYDLIKAIQDCGNRYKVENGLK